MTVYYIVTESADFHDPENQFLNIPAGTVAGVFFTEHEAWQKIDELLHCPLFRNFSKFAKKGSCGAFIEDPDGFLSANFLIHVEYAQ